MTESWRHMNSVVYWRATPACDSTDRTLVYVCVVWFGTRVGPAASRPACFSCLLGRHGRTLVCLTEGRPRSWSRARDILHESDERVGSLSQATCRDIGGLPAMWYSGTPRRLSYHLELHHTQAYSSRLEEVTPGEGSVVERNGGRNGR